MSKSSSPNFPRLQRFFLVCLLVIALLAFAGCAPGPNGRSGVPDAEGEVAGFFLGWWHGLITPVVFVLSLFTDSVSIYEVHNNGAWYNFGFILGLAMTFGGGGNGACRSRRRG